MKNDLISREALREDFKSRLALCNEWIEKAKDKETKIRASAVKAFIGEVIMTIDNAPAVNRFCSYMSDGEVKQPCVEGPCEQVMPKSSLDKPLYEGVLFVDDFGINKVIEVDEHGTVTAERIISKDIFIEAYNKYISGYEKGGKK